MVASSIEVRAALMASPPSVRTARIEDLPAITGTQRASLRILASRYYSRPQIESVLRFFPMMEERLILDGAYYVAEIDGMLAGCGGWSARAPAYQEASTVQPLAGPKVRAMYVHPQFARRGVGRTLLEAIERAMVLAGHHEARLDATLSGVPLYRRCGYQPIATVHAEFPNGVRLPMVCMHKSLRPADGRDGTPR